VSHRYWSKKTPNHTLITYPDDKCRSFFAVFEKKKFCEAVEQGDLIEVKAAGELISGQCFYGTSFVEVFE